MDQLLETSFFDVVLECDRDIEDDKGNDAGGHGHGHGEDGLFDGTQDDASQPGEPTPKQESTDVKKDNAASPAQNPAAPNGEVASLRQQENAKLLELRGMLMRWKI